MRLWVRITEHLDRWKHTCNIESVTRQPCHCQHWDYSVKTPTFTVSSSHCFRLHLMKHLCYCCEHNSDRVTVLWKTVQKIHAHWYSAGYWTVQSLTITATASFITATKLTKTKQRASTSMHSLTFCVRVMSPERHHWKPAVQAATVMLRTPPVNGQSPTSQPRPLAIYGAQFWECPPSPASHRAAECAHPAERSHYVIISWDGRKLVTMVRVMLP